MLRNRRHWSATVAWVALTLSTFLWFDLRDGSEVSVGLLAAVVALLPALVVMVLSSQGRMPWTLTPLHIEEQRSS